MSVFKVGVCDNCGRGDLLVMTNFAGALCYECAKAARDDAARARLAIRRELEKREWGAAECPFVGTDQPCNSCPRWDECMDSPPAPTEAERRAAVEEICRACYFGRKYPGEIYTRCESGDEPCPEKEEIDRVYEATEL